MAEKFIKESEIMPFLHFIYFAPGESTKMKKILFVMATLYNGGAEKSLVNLLNTLPKDKYEIDLMLFKKKGIFIDQIPDNVNLIDAPKQLTLLYSKLSPLNNFFLRKIVWTRIAQKHEANPEDMRGYRWHHFYNKVIPKITEKYDVAVSYITGEMMYFVDEKVNADKKIVFVHNDYRENHLSKKYEEAHYAHMDSIVSISDKCVSILKEVFPQYADKIHYLPNITSSTMVRDSAKNGTTPEFKEGVVNILSIGRLNSQKGFDFAIDAAKLLKQHDLRFCWSIIGNGELEGELKKQIKRNGVEDEVKLLGVRENPYPYIKNCDFVVQTSRFEGKSVVLDESKILGKAIVVTNYHTVFDQVKDGLEGVIVDMTPESICDGILKMVKEDGVKSKIEEYLSSHEYGNQNEAERYMLLFDGN